PAVRKAYSLVEDVNPQAGVTMDAEARKHLFGNR
ncbi:MAG TPA: thiol:disulfide oxidoreductase, partial [Halomonas sp.]|nr:thiol:disulfide oxidoreductase [Halomonas sp.]